MKNLCTVAMLLALSGANAAQAQQFPVFQDRLPVASIDREKLFSNSAYGQALLAQMTVKQTELVAENDRLQADLEREERELTGLRKAIPAEEFLPLAEAFDAKANRIRQDQTQKAAALTKQLETARFVFFRRTEAVIRELMIERGIIYVLNNQAILMSTGEGDITQLVMDSLDALFASGDLQVGGE